MTSTVEPDTDPVAAAIGALTAAARQTRVRGAGTDAEVVERVDFAEIACHVLTTVAANVGGVDALLSGRPGSWEASHVEQIIYSTAGTDADVLRWRTAPVLLTFDVEEELDALGLLALYEEDREAAGADDALRARVDELWEQEKADCAAAYLAEARAALAEWGIPVDVQLTVEGADPELATDELAQAVREYAQEHVLRRLTGADYSGPNPAENLRRSGRTYLERARAGS